MISLHGAGAKWFTDSIKYNAERIIIITGRKQNDLLTVLSTMQNVMSLHAAEAERLTDYIAFTLTDGKHCVYVEI